MAILCALEPNIRSSDHWKVQYAWQSLHLREIDHIAHLPHWGEGSATREPQIQKHHRNIKIRKARVLEPREPSTDLKLHPQFKKILEIEKERISR